MVCWLTARDTGFQTLGVDSGSRVPRGIRLSAGTRAHCIRQHPIGPYTSIFPGHPRPSHTAAPLLHPSRPYGLAPRHRIRQHPGGNPVSTVPPLTHSPPPAPRATDLGALRAIPPTTPPLPSRRENPPPTVVPATRSLTAAQPAQLRAPARRGRCRAQESRGPHPKRRRDAPPPAVREKADPSRASPVPGPPDATDLRSPAAAVRGSE